MGHDLIVYGITKGGKKITLYNERAYINRIFFLKNYPEFEAIEIYHSY